MAEPQKHTAPSNGTKKAARPRKPLTIKSVGMKISDLLGKLPDHDARQKALNLARTLSEFDAAPMTPAS